VPLDIPETSEQVIQRAQTDVRRSWQGSNPNLKNSAIGAIVTSYANRVFDFYLQLTEGIRQSFPDTATETFLERWAGIFGKSRLAATKSSGNIAATGIVTSSIPINTQYITSDGLIFESQSSAVITAVQLSVASITLFQLVATLTTVDDHNLGSNVKVTISGANEPDYNQTNVEIQVTGLKTFTYVILLVGPPPGSPATGTIFVDFDFASVPVESQLFQDSVNDINVNLTLDTPLSLQSPLVGVDTIANVDFAEVGGGTDQESDAALRIRLLEKIQNPVANFNVAAIDEQAREINGVTRTFIQETTPLVGQVTIYFMRDNDADPIPSGSEVTEVKDNILLIKPANTIDADVIVLAPTAVPTAFTFTELTPNTAAMQTAISANLAQFFAEETEVGVNITEEKFITAIQSTIDEDGNGVISFTLSTPTSDVVITSGQIGTLGTVTYP